MPIASSVLATVLTALLLVSGATGSAASPGALGRASTVLTVEAGTARSGEEADVVLGLTGPDGLPIAGAQVLLERRTAGVWQALATVVTDAAGRATTRLLMATVRDDNVVRATYSGDATRPPAISPDAQVELVRRNSTVRLSGPARVVDERMIELSVRWTADDGTPVAGQARLQRRRGDRWVTVSQVATDPEGAATISLTPREDAILRVTAARLDWVEEAHSRWKRIDNVPPARPVRLGPGVPRPRISLPDQERARGAGAAPTISPIPDAVWRSMVGRTWHPGCPVGRTGLRLLRVNYIDFTGYRRRGEMVVAAGAASQFAGAMTELHDRGIPIRSMFRVDRFGWSGRLRGADDVASMAAGNTSAFNCRDVVGRPGVRSPHSYGRALDLNPWENPYRVGGRWLPNPWWPGRSHPRVAWRSRSHPVVSILRRHGFSWTYGASDAQHFDARGASGRVAHRCAEVCH